MKKVKEKNSESKKTAVNPVINNIQETLEEIDVKLRELLELDRGSKVFAIAGWLLMGLSGAMLITIGVIFGQGMTDMIGILIFFIISFLSVVVMIGGYTLAHKGLTGDWL